MGNATGKLTPCFGPSTTAGELSRRHDIAVVLSACGNPLDDGLGHSFCYIKPPSSSAPTDGLFRTISGASVSANASTSPLSASDLFFDPSPFFPAAAASFESSPSFAAVPLQPVPRHLINSGPILRNYGSGSMLGSGPIERGFLSGPIERGFMSGPIDRADNSGNRGAEGRSRRRRRKLGKRGRRLGGGEGSNSIKNNKADSSSNNWVSIRGIKEAIMDAISGFGSNSHNNNNKDKEIVNYNNDSVGRRSITRTTTTTTTTSTTTTTTTPSSTSIGSSSADLSREGSVDAGGENALMTMMSAEEETSLKWAQSKAGEDRIHVVVSEQDDYHENGTSSGGGWFFVGIYDGFNGPDAPDFLLSNLYRAVHKELKGLLWDQTDSKDTAAAAFFNNSNSTKSNQVNPENDEGQEEEIEFSLDTTTTTTTTASNTYTRDADASENNKAGSSKSRSSNSISSGQQHDDVLRALSEGLRKTEQAYLEAAERMVVENPELSLMGSCVLVMLMVGQHIYLMNVGDSRAVLGRTHHLTAPNFFDDLYLPNNDITTTTATSSVQLTVDHNTLVKEEVERIKREHPEDPCALLNDRVKGSLKVTRAFGAGFLKNPKCNEGLLEMFRIDYVGESPYISCSPYLHHHKLSYMDKFLILSSDGLYQYFTNEEAVSAVETFMASTPEGDPAQYLVEELLFRAAKKAGMDFHELLDVPQGERRKYHDDVSIIVISFEGTIWRSSSVLSSSSSS